MTFKPSFLKSTTWGFSGYQTSSRQNFKDLQYVKWWIQICIVSANETNSSTQIQTNILKLLKRGKLVNLLSSKHI